MCGFTRRLVAVVLAAMTVSTGFAPAVVAATTDFQRAGANEAAPPDGSAAALSVLGSQPPRVKKRVAVDAASNLSVGDRGGAERRKQRAVSLLNGTLARYRDDTRVDAESVFHDDAEALRTLADLDANASRLDAVTGLVAAADRETAEQAVDDARRALNLTRDRIDEPGQVRSAEAHVDDAERALDRAVETLRRADDADADTAARERGRALEHLATAWRQAQLAIDTVDAATSPQVRFVTRSDPLRNDSTTTRLLTGTVADVQAYELENVTVQVRDGDPVAVPLVTPTAPGENASFSVRVELSRRVTDVTVTVRDADADDGGTGGQGGAGSADQTDSDTLLLDGDRLTDVFETNTVEMDPQDPDSDAGVTDRDEADDGVIDGHEQFAAGVMPLLVHDGLGTDPFVADTDGDGLTDAFEFHELIPTAVPTEADTDGDGTPDGAADPDDDGLDNLQEQQVGTVPTVADTDGDGLTDGVEVERGLDPLAADRDADGLNDESEERLGTDPRDPDTDDDGVLDGDETFTVRRSDEDLGVSVAVTGQGDLASTISIAENDDNVAFENVSAAVSPFVELDAGADMTEASVSIAYDGSAVAAGNESDLAVYRFNETTLAFEKLPSTVDAENDTVTAETPGFSTFVVFKVPDWNANFEGELPAGRGRGALTPVDTVFVMDSSGSMFFSDPNGFRKIAAKQFVGALLDIDRAAVVDFDHRARLTQPLTGSFGAVNASIDSLDASGGTDIGGGLQVANDHFAAASGADRTKIAILLSDGFTVDRDDAIAQAQAAAAQDVTIITIGFGNPDEALMRRIATITGGQFHLVDDASDLPEVFSRVANNTTKGFDDDEDGLANNVEEAGVPSGRGQLYDSDPNEADTDGDGLNDSVELGQRVGDHHFAVVSDPRDPDTDDDGLDDFIEVNLGTDPFDRDSDDDGLVDSVDPDPTPAFEFRDISGEDRPSFLTRTSWIISGFLLGDAGTPGGFMGPNSSIPGTNRSIPGSTSFEEVRSVEYLFGQILSGLFAIGDLRDLVANIEKGDELGVLLSAIGFIPLVGDGTRIVSKLEDFASYTRQSRFIDEAFRFLNTKLLRLLPESVADDITDDVYRLTGRGDEFGDLVRRGFDPREIRAIFEALNRLPGRATVDDVIPLRTLGGDVHLLTTLDNFLGVDKTLAQHLVGDLRRGVSKFPRSLTRDDVVRLMREAIEEGRVTGRALKQYVKTDAAGDIKTVVIAGLKPEAPGVFDAPSTIYTVVGWPGFKFNRNQKDDDRGALAPPRGLPNAAGPPAAAVGG